MAIVNKGLNAGAVVQVPGWDSWGWLRYGFSTREGGISTVYGGNSLNLGWTKEDDPVLVAENRSHFLETVCGDLHDKAGQQIVTLKQIHSARIQVVREEDGVREGRLQTVDGKALLEGDGFMTNLPGMMLGVQTADCVPVLVADVRRRAVAAFHAGWRGTAARIAEQGIAMMRMEYGSRPEDLVAAVGPSIGSCCYAVGEDLRSEFDRHFEYAEQLFHEVDGAAMHLDLWEANRRQLLAAGLKEGQIHVVGECTACARAETGERKYFSHRAEHGFTGRMMSVVGVAE